LIKAWGKNKMKQMKFLRKTGSGKLGTFIPNNEDDSLVARVWLFDFFKINVMSICQSGSGSHQMAVPVQSISFCIFNNQFFFQVQNALAFNQDNGCHLVLCLLLIIFQC
jgi:hypothetical protein